MFSGGGRGGGSAFNNNNNKTSMENLDIYDNLKQLSISSYLTFIYIPI